MQSRDDKLRVLIVGGGVAGLTVARELTQRGEHEVRLLEASSSLGGNIQTERTEGLIIESGPDSFLHTKPWAAELARELGLGDQMMSPRSGASRVFMVKRGRLVRMPPGMALGVPTDPVAFLGSPLLSTAAKARAIVEPFVPRGGGGDESVATFLERRIGSGATRELAGPLLSGIHAGDVEQLSIESAFPQLVDMERKHGSLVLGMLEGRAGLKPVGSRLSRLRRALSASTSKPSPFVSFRGGMSTFVEALADSLPSGVVATEAAVERIERLSDGRFAAVLADASREFADIVVLAVPAHRAAAIVTDDSFAHQLRGIEYASTATVYFALRAANVQHPCSGSGFIVPPGEGRLLAGTFISSKWEGRAPEGVIALRAFFGGMRDPTLVEELDNAQLTALAKSELERLLGSIGEPLQSRVFRYMRASPQPNVGHEARVATIFESLNSQPGLFVTGAAYRGFGIPDVVREARQLARRI